MNKWRNKSNDSNKEHTWWNKTVNRNKKGQEWKENGLRKLLKSKEDKLKMRENKIEVPFFKFDSYDNVTSQHSQFHICFFFFFSLSAWSGMSEFASLLKQQFDSAQWLNSATRFNSRLEGAILLVSLLWWHSAFFAFSACTDFEGVFSSPAEKKRILSHLLDALPQLSSTACIILLAFYFHDSSALHSFFLCSQGSNCQDFADNDSLPFWPRSSLFSCGIHFSFGVDHIDNSQFPMSVRFCSREYLGSWMLLSQMLMRLVCVPSFHEWPNGGRECACAPYVCFILFQFFLLFPFWSCLIRSFLRFLPPPLPLPHALSNASSRWATSSICTTRSWPAISSPSTPTRAPSPSSLCVVSLFPTHFLLLCCFSGLMTPFSLPFPFFSHVFFLLVPFPLFLLFPALASS